MRKLFTCLGIFALLTVFTAGPALAAGELPAALNGTTWKWSGFQMNRTDANFNASIVVTPVGQPDIQSAYGQANLNGTLFTYFTNNTLVDQAEITFNNNTATNALQQFWTPGDAGPDDISVLSLADWNSTGLSSVPAPNDFYFLPSSDYGVLAGFSKSVFVSDEDLFGTGGGLGGNLAVLTAGTVPAASELTGTWYFYQIGTNSSASKSGITRSGSIDFDGDTATFDNLGTDVTATAITSGVENTGAYADITGYGRLFQNATFDTSKKVLIGTYANATTFTSSFTILLKDGTVGSASDFTDASHKFVTMGSNSTGHAAGLLGYYSTDVNGVINEGNATLIAAAGDANWPGDRNAFTTDKTTVEYGTATVGGVSQANATFMTLGDEEQGQLLGRFNADKTFMVGIFTSDSGDTRSGLNHLAFLVPTQAVVGSVGVESGSYNNATFAANVAMSATTTQALTSVTKETFGLGTDYSALTDMLSFNASINNVNINDGATVTFRITVDDLSVSDISALRWLKMIEGTSANSTMEFTYKPTAATTPEDGHWWFENRDTNAYIASNGQLTALGNYYLYYTIKDQTATASYDRETAAGEIRDPAALFRFSGSSTSSSNSGCVLNPAAGFGLEWLLLLAAPLLAVLRNRFRK